MTTRRQLAVIIAGLIPAAATAAVQARKESEETVCFEVGKEYVLFIDPRAINLNSLQLTPSPAEISVTIVPVMPAPGQTVADCVVLREARK